MPPRKSARAAASAAAAPLPLKGLTIVICGTFEKGVTLASVTGMCKRLGAETHPSVTKAVTHVITTDYYYDSNGAKIRPALDRADVKIVNYDWLLDCEKQNGHVDERAFLFTPKPVLKAVAKAVANGSVSASKAKGKKRVASPEDDDVEEEDEEDDKPPSKKRTKRAATKDDDGRLSLWHSADAQDEDVKPATKGKGKAAAAKKDTKPASSSSAKSATKAAPKKAAKGKAGAKADTPSDSEEEEEEVKEVKKEVKKPGKSKTKKEPVIPVDEYCPLVNYKVYIDSTGLPLDASLNQTNASNNNNKFYRIQVGSLS